METVTITVMLDEYTPEPILRMVKTLRRYQQDQAAKMSHGLVRSVEPLGPEHQLLTYEELLGYIRQQNVEMPTRSLQTVVSGMWNALIRARGTLPLVVACENCYRLMHYCKCPMRRGSNGSGTPAVTHESLKASLKWLDEHEEAKLELNKRRRAQLAAWVRSIEE